MKNINTVAIITGLFLFYAINSYSGTVVTDPDITGIPGVGISEGSDFGFANATGTSLTTSGDITVGGDLTVLGDTGEHLVRSTLDNISTNQAVGNDTVIEIRRYDTASGGTSRFTDYYDNDVVQHYVDEDGLVFARGGVNSANDFLTTGGRFLNQRVAPGAEGSFAHVATMTNTNDQSLIVLSPTWNQPSGTAENIGLFFDYSTIATGSGSQYFMKAVNNSNVKFVVDTDGSVEIAGGISFTNITTVFSDYSVPINSKYVFINASSAARNIYLPDATAKNGAEIRFKKEDSLFKNVIFNTYSSQTINGDSTYTVQFPGNAFTALSKGGNWVTTQATGEVLSFSSYHFSSGNADTYYTGGSFYHFDAADANLTQAATSTTHGSVNEPAGAHVSWVFGGATSVPDGTVFLNLSGFYVDDDGNLTNAEITLDADLSDNSIDDYIESTQKWVGVTKYKLGCTGTCTTYSADGNIGHAKYADFQDRDFTLRLVEVVGQAGNNDANFDLCVKHHDHLGWTYAATGFTPGNGDLACLGTDYGVNDDLTTGGLIAWDRNLNTFINGADNEGLLIEIVTGANNSVRSLDVKYGIVYK
jgi:hypothetical protein